jgi:hypothetical protein
MITTNESAFDLDVHIDYILRGEGARPQSTAAVADEDALVATARLLYAVLPRFHPRFGFEEALAGRLRRRSDGVDPGQPIEFPRAAASDSAQDVRHVWERYRRELVAGVSIASGVSIAIPIAGAALVRWRRSRSSGPSGGIF